MRIRTVVLGLAVSRRYVVPLHVSPASLLLIGMFANSHCRLVNDGAGAAGPLAGGAAASGLVVKQLTALAPRQARMELAGRLTKPVNTESVLADGPPDGSGLSRLPSVQKCEL